MSSARPMVCFGEMLLRLSPASQGGLAASPAFAVHVAGAEANVAISLASLGNPVRMATILPPDELGARAVAALSDHGVDATGIFERQGRMGLFFLNSQVTGREGGLIYDRAQSAFALAEPDCLDWLRLLSGAAWLHVSGVTAALGDRPLAALKLAIGAAKAAGAKVSFDCNYRPALWRGREGEAPAILVDIARQADLLFAGPWDLAFITGRPGGEEIGAEAFEAGAHVAFEMFEALDGIAATSRTIVEFGHHLLGAHLARRASAIHIPPATIKPVVDRIGSGDAFAAALLHGVSQGWDDTYALAFSHRACVLKHGIVGDFSALSADEVIAAL